MPKQLIEKLEKYFVDFTHKMDEAVEKHDTTRSLYYAGLVNYILEVLAVINNTSESAENERLFNKYNLWKSD